MDVFTGAGHYQEQHHFMDAAPLQDQHTDVAPPDYQLPNPHASVPVASDTQVMDVSSLTSGKRLLTEPDPEEASGYIGKYTCPYLECPCSNYVLGFNSRLKRNSHMAVCLYGNGVVYEHVPADGQMPSAPFINEWVEEFAINAAPGNRNTNSNAGEAPAAEPAGIPLLSSLNTFVAPTASQVAPSMNPQQVVEPAGAGLHQLPQHPTAMTLFEYNNNNNGISNIAEVSDKNQPLEVPSQDVFQSAEIGGSFSGSLEGIDLTGTGASHQNATLNMMGADFTDYDWLLDYPPYTWNF